jgi:hypothetical protein
MTLSRQTNPFRDSGRSSALRYDTRYSASASRGHQPPTILKRVISVTLLMVVVILTATYSLKASSQQIYPVEGNEVPSDTNASSIAYLRRSDPSRNDEEEAATDDQPGHYASLDTDESDRQLGRPNDDKEEDEDQDDSSHSAERGTTESVGGALPIYASDSSQNDGELQEEDNSDLGITDSVGGETPFLGTSATTEEGEQEDNEPWTTTEDSDKNSAATDEESRDAVQSETGINEDEERTDGVDEQSLLLIPAREATGSDIHDEEDGEKEGDNVDVQPNEEEDSSATIPTDHNDESNGSSPASTEDSTVQEEEGSANTDTVEASVADVKVEVLSTDEAKSLDVHDSAVGNARLQTDGSLTEDMAPGSIASESGLVQEVDETINATSSQSPDAEMDQNVAEDVAAES